MFYYVFYSFWVIAKEFDIGNYILFIYYENKVAIIIAICLFVYENNYIANGLMVVVLILSACLYFYGADI